MTDQHYQPPVLTAPKSRVAHPIMAASADTAAEATQPAYRRRQAQADVRVKMDHSREGQGNEETSSPKFPVRDEESWEMFGLFINAILADVAVTRAGPPAGVPAKISPKLVRALLYLAQHGGSAMTVSELAEGMGVSLGWASRVADELVEAGLLSRVRDGRDRRVVQLRLTERATAINSRLWSDREGSIVAALSEAAPDERQAIARFLRRLTTELERHASELTPQGN